MKLISIIKSLFEFIFFRHTTPANLFVVLSLPRSGSRYFCDLLNSNPHVLCHDELFNRKFIKISNHIKLTPSFFMRVNIRNLFPIQFMNAVCDQSFNASVMGFKLIKGQNNIVLKNIIKNPNVRKIFLIRKNKIRTYTSFLIAQKTRRWDKKNQEASEMVRVHFDVKQFLKWVENYRFYEESISALKKARHAYLVLFYEE